MMLIVWRQSALADVAHSIGVDPNICILFQKGHDASEYEKKAKYHSKLSILPQDC